LKARDGGQLSIAASVTVSMTTKIVLALCASGLFAQQTDWIAQGNRAFDQGRPEEAATDFAKALSAFSQAGASANDLVHLRITLATAYMEAGDDRASEAALQEAQKAAGNQGDSMPRAELLNAWSALHLKMGRFTEAEAELRDASRIVKALQLTGDLPPTVLHNLASVEMRTGRYREALADEQEAMRQLEKTLAADHPALIRGWASLAALKYMMGEPEEARGEMERAVRSAEITYGPAHPLLADLLMSDAVVLDKLKLKRAARQARNRAQSILGSQGRAARPTDNLAAWNIAQGQADGQVYLRSK
jgi:tetratricopeptide (TPR) repeat protein